MAIGMVVDETFPEPEDPIEAEIRRQPGFDFRLAQPRVAVRIEQALLRRHHDALAVDVDRAAFEHQAWLEDRHAKDRRERPRHRRVARNRATTEAE